MSSVDSFLKFIEEKVTEEGLQAINLRAYRQYVPSKKIYELRYKIEELTWNKKDGWITRANDSGSLEEVIEDFLDQYGMEVVDVEDSELL